MKFRDIDKIYDLDTIGIWTDRVAYALLLLGLTAAGCWTYLHWEDISDAYYQLLFIPVYGWCLFGIMSILISLFLARWLVISLLFIFYTLVEAWTFTYDACTSVLNSISSHSKSLQVFLRVLFLIPAIAFGIWRGYQVDILAGAVTTGMMVVGALIAAPVSYLLLTALAMAAAFLFTTVINTFIIFLYWIHLFPIWMCFVFLGSLKFLLLILFGLASVAGFAWGVIRGVGTSFREVRNCYQ